MAYLCFILEAIKSKTGHKTNFFEKKTRIEAVKIYELLRSCPVAGNIQCGSLVAPRCKHLAYPKSSIMESVGHGRHPKKDRVVDQISEVVDNQSPTRKLCLCNHDHCRSATEGRKERDLTVY